MILSNTVSTTTTLNGVASTATTPADVAAPLGFCVVSNGETWLARPGPNAPIVAIAQGTTAAVNLDWSLGGIFMVTLALV